MRHGSLTRFAVVVLGALTVGACSPSESGDPLTGTGGTGSTGTAGTSANAGTSGGGAGTTGTAGTTGQAGTGAAGTGSATGGAGTTGAAGTGAAGTGAAGTGAAGTAGGSTRSAGCGKDTFDPPTTWTRHDTNVTVAAKYTADFSKRIYWVRPPAGYTENTAYPLIIWGQGCGQGVGPENVPPQLNPASAGAAVIVQLLASQTNPGGPKCASAGPNGNNADSPELPYFDNIVKEVSESHCIDKSKIFLGGYSTGAWFTGLMSCNRANVLRGVGWAAGGMQSNHAPCAGPVAALITVGTGDTESVAGSAPALESIRMRNGCGTTTKPWTPTWAAGEGMANVSSCVTYDGCMPGYPLVYCATPGGHTNTLGDSKLTQFGFWKLWSTLP
jgi:poly(3-hydroxybutyrate) depolymerase